GKTSRSSASRPSDRRFSGGTSAIRNRAYDSVWSLMRFGMGAESPSFPKSRDSLTWIISGSLHEIVCKPSRNCRAQQQPPERQIQLTPVAGLGCQTGVSTTTHPFSQYPQDHATTAAI